MKASYIFLLIMLIFLGIAYLTTVFEDRDELPTKPTNRDSLFTEPASNDTPTTKLTKPTSGDTVSAEPTNRDSLSTEPASNDTPTTKLTKPTSGDTVSAEPTNDEILEAAKGVAAVHSQLLNYGAVATEEQTTELMLMFIREEHSRGRQIFYDMFKHKHSRSETDRLYEAVWNYMQELKRTQNQ